MQKRRAKNLLLVLLTLINSFVLANDKIKGDLLIKNTNVIDVNTGKISYSVDIIISKDKISKIIKNNKSHLVVFCRILISFCAPYNVSYEVRNKNR